jgi:putative tryptophan/tyrosine transport system substrate-binding protein
MKTILLLIGFIFVSIQFAEAQQPTKLPRIGFLGGGSPLRYEAFRQGLRELGYVEGKNIVFEQRSAEGRLDRLAAVATELVQLKVDVIITTGATVTRAAKQATATIPIVMLQDPDPVGNGFVASLARPGGNITGLSSLIAEISGKRLELLKEIVPRLSRVAVLGNSTNVGNAQQLKETERAAGVFGMQLQSLDAVDARDVESAFAAARKLRADALVVLRGPLLNVERTNIIELAGKSRLPATYPQSRYVEEGGLMSYGVSVAALEQRAATYVDKILKGAKPADLPVEQPTTFELFINLKTAKQIGLAIPASVLARADRVIK